MLYVWVSGQAERRRLPRVRRVDFDRDFGMGWIWRREILRLIPLSPNTRGPHVCPAIPRRSGETVLGDAMTDTRTAAEYCSAAIHLWELAAATTRTASHHAFANLAVIYETLADQGEAAENAAALEPKDDRVH